MDILKKIWYIIAAVLGFILFGWFRNKQAIENAEIQLENTSSTSDALSKDIKDLEAAKQEVLAAEIKLPQDEDPESYWERVLEKKIKD